MVHFTKLRLSGFKSFVDPAEVLIEPGLTGVVGPNGCGKSNLVEALRWVMGETSARQMRGGEMDDVIFGGSAGRAPKALADVTLVLDNRRRTAPPQFNLDELEVTRRIERGSGSTYRINGKEVRARDVQLLFADAATGARSPALVSQGKIGGLINAKPAERRALIEEAAGISGLHSRRHEAELRLKAAEANLARLDDVLATLDSQLQGLKRQARQAARYRAVSQQIREVEAQLLHRRWLAALAALDQAKATRGEIEAQVAELTAIAAEAGSRQAEAAAGLPTLRQAETDLSNNLQRLVMVREQLDAEERRLSGARREVEARLAQVDADIGREASRGTDAEDALARLVAEAETLACAAEGEAEAQALAQARLDEAQALADALEAEAQRLTEQAAAAEAARSAAVRRLTESELRRRRAEERLAQVEAECRQAEAEAVPEAALAEAEGRVDETRARLAAARQQVGTAEAARRAAMLARDAAREAVQAEAAERATLRAEEAGLVAVLAAGQRSDAATPVIDAVTVQPGYESALGAALGDDLSAPVDDAAPVRWTTLAPLPESPPLPAGIQSLATVVSAPAALARRLSQTGFVDAASRGAALQYDLRPGQSLVSSGGDLWRWDGFVMAAGAPSAAAVRLQQRNRLTELRQAITEADLRVEAAEERLQAAQGAADVAAETEARAVIEARAAEAAVTQYRDAHAKLVHQATVAASRLAALQAGAEQAVAAVADAAADERAAQEALAAAGDGAEVRERLGELRVVLAERRAGIVDARSALDRLRREAGDRQRRREAIAEEQASWRQRLEVAAAHRQELAERRETSLAELERLAELPLEIAAKREELAMQIDAADEERAAAAAALAAAEGLGDESAQALKLADQALATAREERVRREAALEAAAQNCRGIAQRISERLDCTPEQLGQSLADIPPQPVDDLERLLARLTRERESIGPVNLRAETEAAELEQQTEGMKAEHEDLVAAIAKLRQGISEINREGRERLLASFKDVDQHFRTLFVRLFGGGRAHLELVESDDPLRAGLEIMASPPGKRLQVLSLLSGGEQALTALALIFAVFTTNPAPICVLDEVDAPLDDANVDRFCGLVAYIAETAGTRFLVVTHHRMTMARMDRLFGVTMAERGVSQLVAVDLRSAEELAELTH